MIISSVSYKGGVGKSMFSQNLAVFFAHKGYKVCIVDADDANVTVKWSGTRIEKELDPAIQVVSMTNVKAIIGTVRKLYEDHDLVIIDSPPSYSPISAKIMLVSNLILMPTKPKGKPELETARDLLNRYAELQEEHDRKIPAVFIINEYDPRIQFHDYFLEVLEEEGKAHNVPILKTHIRNRSAYGVVSSFGLGVLEYKLCSPYEQRKRLGSGKT